MTFALSRAEQLRRLNEALARQAAAAGLGALARAHLYAAEHPDALLEQGERGTPTTPAGLPTLWPEPPPARNR